MQIEFPATALENISITMITRFAQSLLLVAWLALVSGCAATDAPKLSTSAVGEAQEELNCGRITGRMKVWILSLRGDGSRSDTSALSRGLQSFGTGIGMTSGSAPDPKGSRAQKLARLEQYNNKLREMGCKSFDLQAELQQTDMRIMPQPK